MEEVCTAISKDRYKNIVDEWQKKIDRIIKIEKDFLENNRKF